MHAELPRFAGSEQHALDDKGRLIVPARFRERLGPRVRAHDRRTRSLSRALPKATWVEFCGRLESVPVKDERYRRFVRYLFAHTEEVACDNQGRMVIPARLREYAGIERDVVSVGLLTRVEIWAKERYGFQQPARGRGAPTSWPTWGSSDVERVHDARPGAARSRRWSFWRSGRMGSTWMRPLAAGGHSRSILNRLGTGRLIAFDADPSAAERATAIDDPRLTFVLRNFRDLTDVLDRLRDRVGRRRALRLGGLVDAV